MALSEEEIQAIRDHARCFQAGTFGRSLEELTPTSIVAQMRGVTFDLAYSQIGCTVLPHALDDWETYHRATWDIMQALGCTDRVSYAELIETIGERIVERLPDFIERGGSNGKDAHMET